LVSMFDNALRGATANPAGFKACLLRNTPRARPSFSSFAERTTGCRIF
jgi:hypothetical protein